VKALESFWAWLKDKFGRIITACGGVLALADLDISPIRDNLESIFSHKTVQGITVALFVASFVRHQLIANQHPKAP
jgi:hypothetical protein